MNQPIWAIDLDGLEKFVIVLSPVKEVNTKPIPPTANFIAYKIDLVIDPENGSAPKSLLTPADKPMLLAENKKYQEGSYANNALDVDKEYRLWIDPNQSNPDGIVIANPKFDKYTQSNTPISIHAGASTKTDVTGCKIPCFEEKSTINGEDLYAGEPFAKDSRSDAEIYKQGQAYSNSKDAFLKIVEKYKKAVAERKIKDGDAKSDQKYKLYMKVVKPDSSNNGQNPDKN